MTGTTFNNTLNVVTYDLSYESGNSTKAYGGLGIQIPVLLIWC
jgi:hypothetical protein